MLILRHFLTTGFPFSSPWLGGAFGLSKKCRCRIEFCWEKLFFALCLLFSSGCVAYPVGAPIRRTHKETLREPAPQAAKTEISSAYAVMKQSASDTFQVGLSASFRIEYTGTEQEKSVTTTEQRLLAFGLYTYTVTTREPPVYGPKMPVPSEWRTLSNVGMMGPFDVELSIPELRHTARQTVGGRQKSTVFKLPAVERDCTVEAVVSFVKSPQADSGGGELALVLEHVKGKTWKYDLKLKASPPPPPPPPPPVAKIEPKSDPVPSPQVREVVREIHHYHETVVERSPEVARAAREFDVEKTVDDSGRVIWRVRILDENLNALDADRKVKPQILEDLREEFAERNPEAPRGVINAWATYTTEDRGRTLVYVGAASVIIPALESLSYNAAMRRGIVTMRLVDGANLAKSKQFVRENISAIVCDKNVVLTAGERPPDGAQYKSLDENFADGVLTVEFESVE